MNNLFIPILLGTAREGRRSEKAAQYVLKQAVEHGQFETLLIDVGDFVSSARTQGMAEVKTREWSEIMKKANGLIIVSPEYNHSYPGELKLMLDQLYEEYSRKPVGIFGVSAGGLGGARMVQALSLVLIELQMIPVRNSVYFSTIQNIFDENGSINNTSYVAKVRALFDEVVWYANTIQRNCL